MKVIIKYTTDELREIYRSKHFLSDSSIISDNEIQLWLEKLFNKVIEKNVIK